MASGHFSDKKLMKLADRISRAKDAGLKAFQYIEEDRGGLNRVLCKICGTPIKDRAPDGRGLGVLMTLAAYTEVTLEFDDGSAHVTPLCRSCAQSSSLEMLEACYGADMAQWQKELNTEDAIPESQVTRAVVNKGK